MIIGIDASRANKNKRTGTEWYSYHLIQELKKMTSPDVIPTESRPEAGRVEGSLEKVGVSKTPLNLPIERGEIKFLLYTNTKLIDDLGVMPSPDWQEKILAWPPKYLWTQLRLWWELLINPPDVLLVPAHTIPFLPVSRKIKVFINVHDVGFKRFPQLYKPIQVWYHDLTMRKIKKRVDLIITISEFSKREIIDLYGVKPEKIAVVYLGYDEKKYQPPNVMARDPVLAGDRGNPEIKTRDLSPAAQDDILEKYKIKKPYLLYVGRLEKKKNIGNLVKAFALAKDHFLPLSEGEWREATRGWENLKLVLAGSASNQYEEIKKIVSDLKLDQEIILPGYIPEGDLPEVIRQAEIFLFPTLYEGFGLPILQAMACATPVITSNLQPHQEVAGEAGVFVDPQSPEQISQEMIKLLIDEDFRQAIIAKGVLRAKDFSWAKTAAEIWRLIIAKA